ncbi:hypothetical protein MAR_002823 [Mya arenaria]|uniref:Uncharacterized protein n=1 Tax=Mya arenaria TaxID=6604 RepID=A0ABY7G483_MYAAR|nr:hypothetical protein MAR_002823 [Mya arenaria]
MHHTLNFRQWRGINISYPGDRDMFAVILFLTLAALTRADITGQHPASGTCLCVTGTNVNARASGHISASVVATVSKPECYKFHGGVLTADHYTWYQLQAVNGHCSGTSTGSCSSAAARADACKILQLANSGAIGIAKNHVSGMHDTAYAYNNIQDTCNGHAAARSHYQDAGCACRAPGGTVCLNDGLLKYIIAMHDHFGYIHINELAGGCHSCHSQHYQGTAVDLHNPAGQSAYMVSHCLSLGGGFAQDEGNHVHCDFR